MRIAINRKGLIDTFSIGSFLEGKSKTGMQILKYSKVVLTDKQIVVTSTDTNIHITRRMLVDIPGAEKTEFCISGNNLVKAMKTLKEDEIIIDFQEDKVVIIYESGEMEFPILDSSDYPEDIKSDDKFNFVIDTNRLCEMLSTAKNFVSDDTLRPILSGVYLSVNSNDIEVCATDGQNMFYDKQNIDEYAPKRIYVVIPKNTCIALLNSVWIDDCIKVHIKENRISFCTVNSRVTSVIINGKYPNFYSVIPETKTISLTTNRKELLQKIQRISLFSTELHKIFSFNIDGNNLKIKGEDVEFRKKCVENMSVDITGESKLKIGFISNSTINALNAITSDNVMIDMTNNNRPVIYHDCDRKNMIVLQMPVLI